MCQHICILYVDSYLVYVIHIWIQSRSLLQVTFHICRSLLWIQMCKHAEQALPCLPTTLPVLTRCPWIHVYTYIHTYIHVYTYIQMHIGAEQALIAPPNGITTTAASPLISCNAVDGPIDDTPFQVEYSRTNAKQSSVFANYSRMSIFTNYALTFTNYSLIV